MITGNIIKILPPRLKSKVENNHELRKILGNINWLTAGIIFKDVLGLFVLAWVARYLGPEKFGLMNYAIAFVGLFSVLSTLGLDNIVIRNILLKPGKKDKYLGTAFVLKLVGSFMMLILSSLIIYFIQPEDTLVRLLVFIISFGYIFKAFDVIDFWFKSKIKAKYSVYARSVSFAIISILKIVFVLTQAPLVSFVWMFSLDFLIASLLLIYFYVKKEDTSLFKWKISIGTGKELLKDSWPLLLSSVATLIYMKVDHVMVRNMLGDRELGLYSSAAKLSQAWYFVPTVIASSFFPSIVLIRKTNRKLYLKRMQLLFDFSTLFTLLFSIAVVGMSPILIRTLYGTEYMESAKILSVLIWGGTPVFWGIFVGEYLVVEDLVKISLYRTFVGAIINITLNIILIPRIGILGSAVSTIFTYLASVFFLFFFPRARIVIYQIFNSFNFFRVLRNIFSE